MTSRQRERAGGCCGGGEKSPQFRWCTASLAVVSRNGADPGRPHSRELALTRLSLCRLCKHSRLGEWRYQGTCARVYQAGAGAEASRPRRRCAEPPLGRCSRALPTKPGRLLMDCRLRRLVREPAWMLAGAALQPWQRCGHGRTKVLWCVLTTLSPWALRTCIGPAAVI